MKRALFFFRRAGANLIHNRQRTLFVLFCIAVGVAAVVSLRTLGLMIHDGLTKNLQKDNRGDMVISAPSREKGASDGELDDTLVAEGGEIGHNGFSDEGVARIREWAEERGYETIFSARHLEPARIYSTEREDADSLAVLTFFVEPERYPFYGELELVEPAGSSLEEALATTDRVVVTERLARSLELAVGDRVHLRRPEPLVVGGILADSAEARLRELEAVLFPYALLRYEPTAGPLGVKADTIFFQASPDTDPVAMKGGFEEAFPGIRAITTEDLGEQNKEISEQLTRLGTTLGLLSLLIGGIGIVNTMLVVVGQRTGEIGVLKTLGLQGRQITIMFLIEALLMGILGSVGGVVLGLGLVAALQGVAENVVAQTLAFRIYGEAVAMGLVTGVLVTLVFGLLPTLAAGKVRPVVVLQPDRTALPRTGGWSSALIVVGLTAVIGVLVGVILDNYPMGLGIAFATIGILAVATLLFRGLVWLFGRLPTFGSAYLRIAQRGIGDRPGRAATTLLALVVGMFSLSSILLMTQTLLNVIDDALTNRLGGDVLAVPESYDAAVRARQRIGELDGVRIAEHDVFFQGEIVAINGDWDLEALVDGARVRAEEEDSDLKEARREAEEAEAKGEGDSGHTGPDRVSRRVRGYLEEMDLARASDTDSSDLPASTPPIDPSAGGLVLRASEITDWLGFSVGDQLTFHFANKPSSPDTEAAAPIERTAEIVGIIPRPPERNLNVQVGGEADAFVHDALIPDGIHPLPTPFILEVEDAFLGPALKELSEQPGLFVLEVKLLNQLLTGIFEKLTALPMIVAILALFASGVIIANTVSLAVLERRRQIGIMKAVGLRSGQVLRMLLLESGLVGLAGGVIGTGLGAAGIVFMGVLSESPGSFPLGTLILLVLLAVAISLGAALLTAWPAAREKPLIVLRYE